MAPDRVDTIIDWEAGPKYGVKMEGTAAAASADVLAELAKLIDEGRLEVPIARVYPLDDVRDAFRELERRTRAARSCSAHNAGAAPKGPRRN